MELSRVQIYFWLNFNGDAPKCLNTRKYRPLSGAFCQNVIVILQSERRLAHPDCVDQWRAEMICLEQWEERQDCWRPIAGSDWGTLWPALQWALMSYLAISKDFYWKKFWYEFIDKIYVDKDLQFIWKKIAINNKDSKAMHFWMNMKLWKTKINIKW